MGEPFPGIQTGVRNPETRLDSWKEIATHLGRDVTTVQRWEKREGMPVHRHLHDKRGSVYALGSELDVWMQSRRLQLEEVDKQRAVTPELEATDDSLKGILQRHPWLVLGGLAVLALLAVTYVMTRSRPAHATGPKITSLVVLPLKNLSGDSGQQYFLDGLTEELTADLARLANLRVISRTSATPYANTHKPLPQIARELNVDTVLTGTVERSGNRIRVRTELIRPSTDEVIWAESYDRDVGDVFRLEAEVSQAIAHEVGIKLTPQVRHRLERKATLNPEAREAYLRALYFLDKDEDDTQGATKCLQYFQEAIAKAPGYAAAYVGISRCYEHFDLSDSEAPAKATAAILKALQLDDELAEAHADLGEYYLGELWDYSGAEREYRRAIELDPNLSVAHMHYGFLLIDLGRTEQGLKEMHRARELDPLSLDIAENTGVRLLSARRYDDALAQFRSVLDMNPNYTRARWMLARTYQLKGMYKEAISECLQIPALPNIDASTKAFFKRRCSLYEKIYTTSSGERFNRNWVKSGRQEIKESIDRDGDVYFIATLYAETGENEKALDLLERAYAKHDSELLQLKVDPRMDNLRSNPRFEALLRRMNFPVE